MYTIVFTARAAKELGKLPQEAREALGAAIDALATDPRPVGVVKLKGTGRAVEFYRIRSGDYRVVYTIEDDVVTVTVTRVGNRRDVYG